MSLKKTGCRPCAGPVHPGLERPSQAGDDRLLLRRDAVGSVDVRDAVDDLGQVAGHVLLYLAASVDGVVTPGRPA
jgi:hypothetical protein